MKVVLQSLLALLILLAVAPTFAQNSDSPEELALYEALQDANALVSAGVSLNDFRARMPQLTILLDRMKRKGINSSNLEDATNSFRQSVSPWSEYITWQVQFEREENSARRELLGKMAASSEGLRDIQWKKAALSLSQYANAKARKADEASAKVQSAAAPGSRVGNDSKSKAAQKAASH